MGIPFCCDRQSKKQATSNDNRRPSRKELLTFVQNRGFFPSGISADLHTGLLAGGAEPMEIVDHNLRPRRFSSARRSIPRRLNFEDFEVITVKYLDMKGILLTLLRKSAKVALERYFWYKERIQVIIETRYGRLIKNLV